MSTGHAESAEVLEEDEESIKLRAGRDLWRRAVRTMLARSTHYPGFAEIVREGRERPASLTAGEAEP